MDSEPENSLPEESLEYMMPGALEGSQAARRLGVRFRLVCIEIDCAGLGWFPSIYQGHLFFQKATYGQAGLCRNRDLDLSPRIPYRASKAHAEGESWGGGARWKTGEAGLRRRDGPFFFGSKLVNCPE